MSMLHLERYEKTELDLTFTWVGDKFIIYARSGESNHTELVLTADDVRRMVTDIASQPVPR